jgi:hypothetical protein
MTSRLTKHTSFIEFRWPLLATVALCALLPGCPMTDNYFIDLPSGGAAQLVTNGGSSEISGAPSVAGGPDIGGSVAGGPEYHMGTDPVGGGGTDHGTGMSDAGSSDVGGSDAGSSSSGFGGTGGTGGLGSMGGKSSGGTGGGGSSNGGSSNGGTGTAGWPGNWPQPACADGVGKGDTCGLGSPQTCYKGCGPDNVGYKQLICQLGTYQETQSGGCTFPKGHDYTCYAVPPTLPAACPAGVPRGGQSCQVASCTVCYGGSGASPQYEDSTGADKYGYCVCSETGVWTCGTRPESWPCPGPGCQCPGPGCQ